MAKKRPSTFLIEGRTKNVRVKIELERKYFMIRMGAAYTNMKERLGELDFTRDELRAKLLHCLLAPCRYCGEIIKGKDLSVDHIIPVSRGGAKVLENLDGICKRCNTAKSDLTSVEFMMLLITLDDLGPAAKESVLRRLATVPVWLNRFNRGK